jgi:hypothetical protein
MDVQSLNEMGGDSSKKTFFNHVFSTTEEGKAEIFNAVQYSSLGVIPIVILNKLIQRFIPEADTEKSSLEILVEIFLQLIIMFCGVIVIHRIITFIPTYSGFIYDNLVLTNVILAFLIIVLSIQTKLGIKVNILVDRVNELWNGPSDGDAKANVKKNVRVNNSVSQHSASQADYLDNSHVQSGVFPPAPIATARPRVAENYDNMMHGSGMSAPSQDYGSMMGPMPANGVLGGAFGSAF